MHSVYERYERLLWKRKPWAMYKGADRVIMKRAIRAERFFGKLYIPTRQLKNGFESHITPMNLGSLNSKIAIKWGPFLRARKPWKRLNSFHPGHYR